MTSEHQVFSEAQLHAWIDDQLDPKQANEIEEWLQQQPELVQELRDYREYNEGLRMLCNPVLQEPVPERLKAVVEPAQTGPRRKSWFSFSQAASLFLAIAIGLIAGWISHGQYASSQSIAQASTTRLVQDAFAYHVVYTPEVLHPVEVTASEQQHLTQWLSKRLKTRVIAPPLQQQGFKLLGGRLLESGNQPAAQFMYENEQGQRLTLFTRHRFDAEQETAFHYASDGNINGFYWVDDQLSFVIVSEIPRAEISKVSHAVYQALNN